MAGVKLQENVTIEEATSRRIKALKDYYRTKKGTKQLRKTFLEELAELIASKDDNKKESIIK